MTAPKYLNHPLEANIKNKYLKFNGKNIKKLIHKNLKNFLWLWKFYFFKTSKILNKKKFY